MNAHAYADRRLRVEPSDTRVCVWLGDELLAESSRPLVLRELGRPTRYYLPREDVRTELLARSTLQTFSPSKGDATHWSTATTANVAWSYEEPRAPAADVKGHIAFYENRVQLDVDEA